MGQQQSQTLSYRFHECICNKDTAGLEALLESMDSQSEPLDDTVFVELVERQWEPSMVMKVAKVASDDNIAVLLSTAILHTSTLPIADMFALLKDPARTIESRQLKPLFIVACDHEDLNAVKALIQYKCYDADDARALTTIVRRQMNKTAPDIEFIELVMKTLPGKTEAANYLLTNASTFSKTEETAARITKVLKAYLK